MPQSSKNIRVAIWMVTYNHEAFVEQAVESVMIQQTDFVYKLFIGEDFSTDNTRNLCLKLKEKYPEKIDLIISDRNVGAHENALRVYKACFNSDAEYIAMLEGDDYWIDPDKLQQQIDSLERNANNVLCGHLTYKLKDGKFEDDKFKPGIYDLSYVIKNGRVGHTVSWVYRNVLSNKDLDFIRRLYTRPNFYSGDQLLLLLLLVKGDALVLDTHMAIYRLHVDSIMRNSKFIQNHNYVLYAMYNDFNVFTRYKFSEPLKETMVYWLNLIIMRDTIIANKIKALKALFAINLFLWFRHMFFMPYYIVKSILYSKWNKGIIFY